MKKILVSLLIVPFFLFGQTEKKSFDFKTEFKKFTKFSTFYGGVNGGTSLADDDVYSITTGTLNQNIIETPFDYSIIFGVRKIARFGYLNYNLYNYNWSLVFILAACLDPGSIPGISTKNI